MDKERFHKLETTIGYTFQNIDYLITALTHKSYANERKINFTESYERSEFLGDAILELIVSEYLYENYPNYSEGKLTRMRASLVCEFTLSRIAKELDFGKYVLLSKGEEGTGGRDRSSILCDLFESVLGAVYLDGGLSPAKNYVHRFLLDDAETHVLFYDAKTTLQELVQKTGQTLSYVLIEESGPDHHKLFRSEVQIDGVRLAEGAGTSRKASEQEAACNALIHYKKKKII